VEARGACASAALAIVGGVPRASLLGLVKRLERPRALLLRTKDFHAFNGVRATLVRRDDIADTGARQASRFGDGRDGPRRELHNLRLAPRLRLATADAERGGEPPNAPAMAIEYLRRLALRPALVYE
jgi:hypothetical protein